MLFLASESAFMVRGAEVLTLRLLIDLAWRRTLAYCVRTSIDPRAVTAGRFHMALRESFGLPAAARLAKELPHSPRATAHRFGRFQRQFPMVGMKSVLDWVLYFRFVVGLGLGVSQATRAAELGSCMRSIRRVRVRLAPWLATPPGDLHPWDVIDALRRRLTPPPG